MTNPMTPERLAAIRELAETPSVQWQHRCLTSILRDLLAEINRLTAALDTANSYAALLERECRIGTEGDRNAR